MSNIFGYPNYISGGSGGGTEVNAGAGLSSTTNPDGSITLAASGPFLTWYYSPEIANSRQVVGGNNVTVSTAIDGQLVISAAATGGGAPTVSSYIVGTTEASLPNSSVATEGNGITIAVTPGGAATFGVSTAITGADILTWQPGDTIFTDRRALILGSGLSADFGSNTLTLSVTGQNAGTVTSVDVAAPFQTSSGAVTTAGTITLSYQNQLAGTLLIAPSGSTGSPTFRRILGQDLPIFGSSSIAVTTNATGGLVLTSLVTGGGGGSGTLTNLTVGDLSPIFTSNVANPTTTPAVTYSLTNAAQNSALLGPKTGGTGSPTYRAITGQDLGNLVAGANMTISAVGDTLVFASTASGGGGGSVSSFSAGNLSPLFTTNVATATTTPALTFTIAQGASGQFVAGPVSGSAANLALRALATSDLPVGIPTVNLGAGTVDDLEFGYLDGVTSAIQTQFSNKQPLDATLTALAAYNTNGLFTQTAADTFTGRTITGTANEVTVTNGDGVAGNPTLSLPTGIDATKIADGTVTSTEFQYINTLSSNAQTQIDGKAANTEAFVTLGNTSGLSGERRLEVAGGLTIQDLGAGNAVTISGSAMQPLDATLTALAAYNTNGILTQTAADTFTGRTLTGTANEITVTNGDGVSGNPTFSLPTGIDATKIADGSVTSAEFQYINTLSSNAQTQIDGKAANTEAFLTLGTTSGLTSERNFTVAGGLTQQDNGAGGTFVVSASALQPLDATLTALAAYNTTGFITQTGVDTFAGRTLAVAGGLTIQEAGSVITISASGVTGGGGGFTANTITTNATAAVSNSYFVDLSSGNVTLALPTAVSQGGKEIKVKIIANTVPPNTLTLNATATNGSGTIDGSASTITSQYTYDAWTFQSANGSAWYIF
jgi:hypothetical protein